MAPPNNPRTARLTMTFVRDSRKFINALHMAREDQANLSLADLQIMAQVLVDWWDQQYKQLAGTSVSLTNVHAVKQDPSDPLEWDVTPSPPIPGTFSGVLERGSNTLALSWRSMLAGRKFRGRTYTVGMCENVANPDDTVSSAFVNLAITTADNLLGRMFIPALNLIVFHRLDNTFTPLLFTVVDNLIDSQRRRLANRGM